MFNSNWKQVRSVSFAQNRLNAAPGTKRTRHVGTDYT